MAEGFSILDPRKAPHTEEGRAPFFVDLNLDQIIDKMVLRWGNEIRKYYYYFPADRECESYRREVYTDVKKDEIYEVLLTFTERLQKLKELRTSKEKVKSQIQKSVWLLREMNTYCDTYEELAEGLEKAKPSSKGMTQFLELLKQKLGCEEYRSMREHSRKLLQELMAFRFVITYEKDRISVQPGTTDAAYEAFVEENGDKERAPLVSPFFVNPMITELENSCLEILAKKKPEIFDVLKNLAERYDGYEDETLRCFAREIFFYLSFCTLQREMKEQGFVFCTPTVSETERMEAKGLYDLALALVAVRENRRVVSNALYYGENESFFVLTGPNQGGKTTFARSLGQLVYFTKMGLDVPASSANVHYFKDIQTHFSVEESPETGRGKLKEELVRLAPMMEEHRSNTFVIINELFTTAASYDARIMGGKVLEHFIDLGCRGIYVTHLKELTEIHPKVVSLRAMLNEDRLQTFEIRRSAAEESACAANQVNKYRLTYEQLKERL